MNGPFFGRTPGGDCTAAGPQAANCDPLFPPQGITIEVKTSEGTEPRHIRIQALTADSFERLPARLQDRGAAPDLRQALFRDSIPGEIFCQAVDALSGQRIADVCFQLLTAKDTPTGKAAVISRMEIGPSAAQSLSLDSLRGGLVDALVAFAGLNQASAIVPRSEPGVKTNRGRIGSSDVAPGPWAENARGSR